MYKWMKKDIGRLWRAGAVHMGISGWMIRAAGIVQRILLAHILGVDGIGHVAVANSAMNLIRLPAGLGMFTAVGKLIAENNGAPARQRRALGTSLRIAIAASLAVMVVAWAVLRYTPAIADPVANRLLSILVVSLPIWILVDLFRCALQGQRRMRASAALDGGIVLLGMLLIVPITWYWMLSGWVAHQIIMAVLAGSGFVWLLRPIMSLEWDSMFARRMTRIGGFAFLSQITGALILNFDTLCLSGLLKDPGVTGIYNTASMAAQQMLTIPGALLTVTFPFVAENRHDLRRLKARYKELSWKMGGMAVCLSVAAFFVAPLFFKLFGPGFLASIAPFRVLTIGFVARCLYVLDNTYLDGLGRTDLTFVSGLMAAIVTVVFNLIFIPRWGIMGAAWASTLAMCFSLLVRHAIVHYFVFIKHAMR